MLKTLDILIGVSVVMLLVSMAVTMLTQIAVGLFNAKAQALKASLAGLISRLDPDLVTADAKAIAKMVLNDPMLTGSGIFGRGGAAVIHRDELTQLLLDLARAPVGGQPAGPREKIHALLAKGGISQPAETGTAIRAEAANQELKDPGTGHAARMSAAVLTHANRPVVAGINAWFDATIDRAVARFTAMTRVWSFAISVVLVLAVQLDVLMLINRLSTDTAARTAVVQQAASAAMSGIKVQVDSQMSDTNGEPVTLASLHLDGLVRDDLIQIPSGRQDWLKRWNESDQIGHAVGMVLSVALLTLGAPFWYGLMKNLLQLRSLIAGKDDIQRNERQDERPPG